MYGRTPNTAKKPAAFCHFSDFSTEKERDCESVTCDTPVSWFCYVIPVISEAVCLVFGPLRLPRVWKQGGGGGGGGDQGEGAGGGILHFFGGNYRHHLQKIRGSIDVHGLQARCPQKAA